MIPHPRPRSHTILGFIPSVISVLLVLVSALVIAGWIFEIPSLTRISPQWASMTMNTAACFELSGVALWCLRDSQDVRWLRRCGRGFATFVSLIALLTLGEHVLGMDFGSDQLLMQELPAGLGSADPGRMSGATALSSAVTMLTQFGCDDKQGYLISRPVQPSEVPALLRKPARG